MDSEFPKALMSVTIRSRNETRDDLLLMFLARTPLGRGDPYLALNSSWGKYSVTFYCTMVDVYFEMGQDFDVRAVSCRWKKIASSSGGGRVSSSQTPPESKLEV